MGVFLGGGVSVCVLRGAMGRDILLVAHADELCAFGGFVGVDDGDLVCYYSYAVALIGISESMVAVNNATISPKMDAHAVIRLLPYSGLNSRYRESSTMRINTSGMLNGFRISGSMNEMRSSAECRGGSDVMGERKSSEGRWREATQSRAFRMASNLGKISTNQSNHAKLRSLIFRHLISQSSQLCMNLCTTKLFSPNNLSRSRLDQRRTSQKDLSLVLNEDGVV